MNCSGIYEIVNSNNGKRYVGSTVSFSKRWWKHKRLLNQKKHSNLYLQRAWSKHGETAFNFSVVLICARNNLLMYEQKVIDATKPDYNVSPVAGLPHGPVLTEEHKRNIGLGNRGVRRGPLSLEVRMKISDTNKGKIKSVETRRRLSIALSGRTFSPETLAKMSASALGKKRPRSPEHQAAISASQRGKTRGPLKPETRAKLVISQRLRRENERQAA